MSSQSNSALLIVIIFATLVHAEGPRWEGNMIKKDDVSEREFQTLSYNGRESTLHAQSTYRVICKILGAHNSCSVSLFIKGWGGASLPPLAAKLYTFSSRLVRNTPKEWFPFALICRRFIMPIMYERFANWTSTGRNERWPRRCEFLRRNWR